MIRKTSETRPLAGNIVNAYNDSQTSAYSTEYINNINTFDTTEFDTGKKWIDGKTIYSRVIEYGTLPNNTTKDVNHNISNVDKIWIADGFAINSQGFSNMLSLCVPTALGSGWYFGVNSTVVRCQTGSDRSGYTAYVILEYTKSN